MDSSLSPGDRPTKDRPWYRGAWAVVAMVLALACGGANPTSEVLAPATPNVVSQPTAQTVLVGQTATFSLSASGFAPLTYQWLKDGVAIPAATAATYTTPAAAKADDGSMYSVVVTNRLGSLTSAAAPLNVQWAPSVLTQPADLTVIAGQAASFTVAVDGNPAPTYQWQRDLTDIPGATAASYTLPAAALGDSGTSFRCQIQNAAGALTSRAALLTVNPPPGPPVITAFSATPASVTLGQTTTLAWTVAGATSLSVDNTVGSVTGLTSKVVTPAALGSLTYTLTATNGFGSTQATTQVTVTPAPSYALTVSVGTGVTGTPATTTSYLQGTSASYSYVLQAGYQNLQVTLDGTAVAATGSVTMNAPHSLAATAQVQTFTLSASAGANGTISPSGVTTVNYGGSQAYAITPNSGYQVASLLVDGTSVGAPTAYAFANITANHTIAATFAPLPTYALTVNLGTGVTGTPPASASYLQGTSVGYGYALQTGYQNLQVMLDGGAVAASGSVTMNAPHTLNATAQLQTFPITAGPVVNGTISPVGTTQVNYGGNLTYAMTANTGYQLVDVLVDGVSVGAVSAYAFTNVTSAHSITATFQILTFPISATSGANGSVTPAGTTLVNYGSNQTYTITPDPGYQVASASADGVSLGAVTSHTFTNVTTSHSISASFSPLPTFPLTVTVGGGITGSPTTGGTYAQGTVINYTYALQAGYQNLVVTLDGNAVAASGSITMNGPHILAASALIQTYTINASAGANGSISSPGITLLNFGSNKTYTITPNGGYLISDVLVDGYSVGAVASYTFTNLSANHTILATFTTPPAFVLTVNLGSGTTGAPSGTASYTQGTAVHYSYLLQPGYQNLQVTLDGVPVPSHGDVTMDAPHTLTVTAQILTYTLTATAGANGSISPAGATTVNFGGSQLYTITPDPGYQVANVVVDGASVGAPSTYTVTNVTYSLAISATFSALPTYALTVNLGAGTTGAPAATASHWQGSVVAYSYSLLAGYQNLVVTLDGNPVAASGNVTMAGTHTLATSATPIAPNAELALPTAVHPSDAWMKASVPIQAGMTYAWTVNPDTSLSGQSSSILSYAAGGSTGTFTVQADVQNPASTHATASRTVTIQTGTWLVKNGGLSAARNGRAAALLPSGRVLMVGGSWLTSTPEAAAELYDPATASWIPTGSLATARYGFSATVLANGKVLVTGGTDGSTYLVSSELYDPATGLWTGTGNLNAPRSGHSAILLANGNVLVVGGSDGTVSSPLASAELYDATAGTWSTTGSLATGRSGFTLTLLGNGKALVASGRDSLGATAHPELYDPGTHLWSATGHLSTGRSGHAAVLLGNGKVLVEGGLDTLNNPLASAELYDPTLGTWSSTGSLATARSSHTLTLLTSGKVLVAGGTGPSGALLSSELYTVGAGTWASTGSLSTARSGHVALLLADGTVLLAGGSGTDPLGSSESYDPTGGTWTPIGSLGTARVSHTATLLGSGKTLVAGGSLNGTALGSALLYDASARTWTATGSLATARTNHTATLLQNGRVLVVGGLNGATPLGSAEIFDPAVGTWSSTGSLTNVRSGHTATLLADGKVLVAGGADGSGSLASSEVYDPAGGTWSATSGNLVTARTAHTATLLGNGNVFVAGGRDASGALANAELFDPTSGGTWTATASLIDARSSHTAITLGTGEILLVGGDGAAGTLQSVERFNATGSSRSATGGLSTARSGHAAILLGNGTVLVVGGANTTQSALATCELYDPTGGTWSATGRLNTGRTAHTATLLADGTVMVGFGTKGDVVTEIYKP